MISFVKHKWKRNIYFRLTTLFIIFYIVGTYGIYIYERDKNPAFKTLYESCWSTLVYILSGFDVGSPQTVPGRIFSILILVSSIGMLGMIIGQVTSILLQRRDVKMKIDIEETKILLGMITAIDKKDDEKYQFHFQSEQYMNAEDDPLDIREFFANNPELKNPLIQLARKNNNQKFEQGIEDNL